MDLKYLTQENFDRFMALIPADQKRQPITFADLVEHAREKDLQKLGARFATTQLQSEAGSLACPIACAGLAVDIVLIVVGAAAIRKLISESAVAEVAKVIEPSIPEIRRVASVLTSEASATEKAWALFSLIKSFYTAGMIEAIVIAMFRSVPYYDWVLYGLLAAAEIAAMCLTDGASEVAVIAAELVLCGFVISDSYKVDQACF